tara:strand:+ start:1307 stop:1855 length:549 start_codon:yes stop_codon:yes gene_type:complete
MTNSNPNAILHFWFKEISAEQWWLKDLVFDQEIKSRFLNLHRAANKGELFGWRDTAQGRLAEIIILDQFSRNIYRESPQAFASDPLALVLAQEAIALGLDMKLAENQRSFFYLPYMHSESLLIHSQAIMLYEKLGNASNLAFEIKHQDIIKKFARYPHRNAILGRKSSAEEVAFLQQPDSAF